MRAAGVAAWSAVCADPSHARTIVARVLRESRGLHSAERRLVQDMVFALVRHARALELLVGSDDAQTLWTALLVLAGLDRDEPPFTELVRRFEHRGDELLPDARLALRHGLPTSTIARLRAVLGADTEAFLVASDTRAPVAVRANRCFCTREQLAARLLRDGIPSAPSSIAPDGLVLAGRPHLPSIAAYVDGWLEVMDEGSQRIASLVLGVSPPGSLVIDACAGAGGKTLALASGGRSVLALDVRTAALRELERRAARAGERIAVRRVDPEGPLPLDLPRAPTVLVDAPCSGSGVLRRHPAQRFGLDDGSIAAHGARQKEILVRMSSLVIPTGRLVYTTCSVLREENEDVVEAFLARHPGFRRDSEIRLWPHLHGTDGFYAAILAKNDADPKPAS